MRQVTCEDIPYKLHDEYIKYDAKVCKLVKISSNATDFNILSTALC